MICMQKFEPGVVPVESMVVKGDGSPFLFGRFIVQPPIEQPQFRYLHLSGLSYQQPAGKILKRGTMLKSYTFLFVFIVFCALSCFSEDLQLKDQDIIEFDLGPIPPHIKPPVRPSIGPRFIQSSAAPPVVLLLHVGYKDFAAPDDAVFECWENFDSYQPCRADLFWFHHRKL